ncbi:hypothetical protein H0H93_014941 [Arthromyces matolae]|nr:hypothetical protein H0H93_014941 [Arthromyces matolae]
MAAQGHGGGRRPAFATPPLPEPQVPAWTQWRPNPLIAPTPDNSVMMSPPPVSPPAPARGLFGALNPLERLANDSFLNLNLTYSAFQAHVHRLLPKRPWTDE